MIWWKTGLATICNVAWLSQYNNAGLDSGTFKSWKMYLVFVIAWYSTSPDDMDTLVCFLDFQEIIEFFWKMQNPEIDHLDVQQPPESESQYACYLKLFLDSSRSLWPGVPLMYLRTRKVAFQCGFLGSCINWLSLRIEYTMSDLVVVKYINLSINRLIYLDRSTSLLMLKKISDFVP